MNHPTLIREPHTNNTNFQKSTQMLGSVEVRLSESTQNLFGLGEC